MMCDGWGVIDAFNSQCPHWDGGRKREHELSPLSSKKRETVETKCQRWEFRTDGGAREWGRRAFFFFCKNIVRRICQGEQRSLPQRFR